MVSLDIINLLALILLDDNLIRQSRGPHAFDALHQGLLYIDLAPGLIKILGGHAHDQIISQRPGPLQQTNMAVMQQIIGSVCDHSRHKIPLRYCASTSKNASRNIFMASLEPTDTRISSFKSSFP